MPSRRLRTQGRVPSCRRKSRLGRRMKLLDAPNEMEPLMPVRVRYTAQLRAAVGKAEEEIELPDGSSVAAVIEHVWARLPAAAAYLQTAAGRPQPSLLVVLNSQVVPIPRL